MSSEKWSKNIRDQIRKDDWFDISFKDRSGKERTLEIKGRKKDVDYFLESYVKANVIQKTIEGGR